MRAADVDVQLPAGDGFVIQNNAGTVERLRVDEATGNISRNGALFVHTTGSANLFVGYATGGNLSTGYALSAFGRQALQENTTGRNNSAFGAGALFSNTTGRQNSAFGSYALFSNLGAASNLGSNNSAFGSRALASNANGGDNSAFGTQALYANINSSSNAAFGYAALKDSTAGSNSAFGSRALTANTTGSFNNAFGSGALDSNTSGYRNGAVGSGVLSNNTTGYNNAGFGDAALFSNTTGAMNAAFGSLALNSVTTGARNVGIGYLAGVGQTIGNDNIYLASLGVAGESGKIKIGSFAHTETFIEGIAGNTATGGVAVLVNSSNELHTLVSSARFKESVRDMGEASEALMELRPVTFLYREEAAKGDAMTEYGLIAEEVAEVAPELVAYDNEGFPYSVRYHVLPSLLLNELQKDRRTIHEHELSLAAQQRTLESLQAHLDGMKSELAALKGVSTAVP